MHSVARRTPRSTRWAVALAAVVGATGATLIGSLTIASANQIEQVKAEFWKVHPSRPVAGQMFEGLSIFNETGLNGSPERPSAVHCDAAVGGKRLHGKLLVYGKLRRNDVQVIVCGWRIPAGAAGKTLRFWKNDPNAAWCRCAVAVFGNSYWHGPAANWRIMKPRQR